MTLYRRQLVGLPLQRSFFRHVGRAGEILGLTEGWNREWSAAWLDEDGNLFLDESRVELLASTLLARLPSANLEAMERAHRAACTSLMETSEQASRTARSLNEDVVRGLLHELGSQIAAFLPYGILSKFVPDVLLQGLASMGDERPAPLPARSPGIELTEALLALSLNCRALDYSPERLEAEWPKVAPEAAELLHDFCKSHSGFGPLAWDAPGYEDPKYVIQALRAVFNHIDLEEMRARLPPVQRLQCANRTPDASSLTARLRRFLAFWLDFLERETWYVRRAFFTGVVPLLRRLLPDHCKRLCTVRPEDILFLEMHELTATDADLRAAQPRRQKYLGDIGYLARHGIEPGRLRTILEAR